MFMRKTIAWYRSHDPMTQVKLKSVLDQDISEFQNVSLSVLVITLKELGSMYDLSGSDFGDQVIKELVRLASCFFNEDYIYRDGYNSFIILDHSDQFSDRLTRFKDNVSHYEINHYRVYTTLQFGFVQAYLTAPAMIYELVAKARRNQDHTQPHKEKAAISPAFEESDLDSQTSLLTMDAFTRYATAQVEKTDLVAYHMIICFFDISRFKRFNKRYGYEAGNRMMRMMVKMLKQYFPECLIAHLSADRFVVLCPEQGIEDLLHQINVTFDEYYFDKDVTIHTGIYRIREITRITTAIDRARLAASTIQEGSRERVRYFDEETRKQLLFESYVVEHLEEALQKGDIKVYYQPIYRVITHKIAGLEAAPRWHRVHDQILEPKDFIPILEKHHMIHILDTYMIKQVCKDYAEFRNFGGVMEPCSLNISVNDFELCDMIDLLNKETALYEIPRNHVRIELTANKVLFKDQYVIEELERLKYLGYELWLEDYGDFISNYKLFSDELFNAFKLDAQDLDHFDHDDQVIMQAQILTAKRLGIRTIMKGVTTKQISDLVAQLGIDYMQGSYFKEYAVYSRMHPRYNNLDFELPAEYHYQEAISRQPLYEAYDQACCIVEVEHHFKKFLAMNGAFQSLWHNLQVSSISALEDLFNHKPQVFKKNMRMIVNEAKRHQQPQPFSVIVNTFLVEGELSAIASMKTKEAYMIRIRQVKVAATDERPEKLLEYLASRYEQAYLYQPSRDQATPILHNSGLHDNVLQASALMNFFVDHQLYPEEEEHYRQFMSSKSLLSRIYSSPSQCVEDNFRILDEDGHYPLKRITISLCEDGKDPLLLYTISSPRTQTSYAKSLINKGGFSYSNLFDNILHQLKIGIFWKDRDRRFVGTNRTFLKYFGFASEKDLLGKRDEDLGYHLDPMQFKEDEEHVINEGATIINREGICVVDGNLRKIRNFKLPIYEQGEIIGLFGCFEDVTDRSIIVKNFLNYQDQVTKCANKTGLEIALDQYIKEYTLNHIDFSYICLSIDNLKVMIHDEGMDQVNILLKKIADVLKKLVRNQGLVAYIYGDLFVVISQETNQQAIADTICLMGERIQEIVVSGSRLTPYLTSAYALYSEAENQSAIDDLVLKRLLENKQEMKKKREENTVKQSLSTYLEIVKSYEAVFTHIIIMDEDLQILHQVHTFPHVHDYLMSEDVGYDLQTQKHHNTYSGIEMINGESYYCVTKWQELGHRGYIIELSKKVEM